MQARPNSVFCSARVLHVRISLQGQRNGFAQMFVLMRSPGTFSAYETGIANDLHEILGFILDLMLLPFAEGFCHAVQNNIRTPDEKRLA